MTFARGVGLGLLLAPLLTEAVGVRRGVLLLLWVLLAEWVELLEGPCSWPAAAEGVEEGEAVPIAELTSLPL